ncbi:protein phosphatase 2C domain-containing protein [Streptomyces sp. NPDC102462]|uniref:protein phosphatase 2C domain-containing protein n=1 Tax=Streptomyces sp. NPDC102462 TaxID=3366178 RepID=UPI0038026EDD
MSQQGGGPARDTDDWWGQLYDDSTEDTGPAPATDSLDDRFASASHTLGPGASGPPAAEATTDRGTSESWPGGRPGSGSWPGEVSDVPEPGPGAAGRADGRRADTAGAGTDDRPGGEDAIPGQDAIPGEDAIPGQDAVPGEGAVAVGRASVPPDGGPVRPRPGAPWEPPGPVRSAAPGEPPSADSPPWPAGPKERGSEDDPAAPLPAPTSPAEPAAPTHWALGESAPRAGVLGATGPAADGPLERTGQDDRDAAPEFEGAAQDAAADPGDGPGTDEAGAGARDVAYVGSGPPTYDAEPTALPLADPDGLDELVADTVLDGARSGVCTLRAASVRGDSARYRGEPRRDALLTARFGTGEQALILVAMATGARATPGAHRAAAEACQWIGRAVGRSHQRLVEDIHAARRGDLKSGLHRLTDHSLGKLRASAAEQGIDPEEYAASLRCLLLPARPDCRTRVFFGIGEGGLFRLRDGAWQDIEPQVSTADTTGDAVLGFGSPPAETPDGDRLTMDLGIPTPPSPYEPAPEPPREPFRFRASVARPGDALLMCSGGLAEPLRGEPALCAYLARRWSGGTPPGLAAFLADTQVRVKGYADDRTVAAVWEA